MGPETGRQDCGARIGFVGDLIFARRVSEHLAAGLDPAKLWGDMIGEMRAADAMIGNLEGPITARTERWPAWKAYYFRADPRATDALVAGNFRAVSLANNHMLDHRAEGLADTRAHLAAAGIGFAGAGANQSEARAAAVFEARGLRVGLISVSDQMRAFAAGPTSPGTFHVTIDAQAATARLLRELVATLAAEGADLKVLAVHWGGNYQWWPGRRHRAFARAAIDAGFHVVHGHSAHILQAMEFHGAGVILYDTGNYLNDFRYGLRARNDRTFLFLVDAEPGRVRHVRLVPVRLDTAVVNRASGGRSDAMRRAMVNRCRGYAVTLTTADGDLLARRVSPDVAVADDAHQTAPMASASSAANSTNR